MAVVPGERAFWAWLHGLLSVRVSVRKLLKLFPCHVQRQMAGRLSMNVTVLENHANSPRRVRGGSPVVRAVPLP